MRSQGSVPESCASLQGVPSTSPKSHGAVAAHGQVSQRGIQPVYHQPPLAQGRTCRKISLVQLLLSGSAAAQQMPGLQGPAVWPLRQCPDWPLGCQPSAGAFLGTAAFALAEAPRAYLANPWNPQQIATVQVLLPSPIYSWLP